ncbi:MAG: hypothetical protein ACTSPN_10235 [Promethearchaeota archaeon]
MNAFIYISIYMAIFSLNIITLIIEGKKYKPENSFLFSIIFWSIFQASYFIFFILATFNLFHEESALIFWNLSIFFQIASITLWTSFFILELHKNSKFKIMVILMLLFISGIIFGLLYESPSFDSLIIDQHINYYFINPLVLIFIVFFNFSIVIVLMISQIKGYSNYHDKKLGQLYYAFTIIFCTSIILYSIFLINQNVWIKHGHLIVYLLNNLFLVYILIKKPSLFRVFTNKLYDFIVFHKSGILLYSYNFETRQEVEESLLKGSILIGINHILSNFSNLENQISVIKMSDRGIIFNFNNEFGYATLLIAKHKNSIVENAVNEFNLNFAKKYLEPLTNLKGLIDVSKFRNTSELVRECFRAFLS